MNLCILSIFLKIPIISLLRSERGFPKIHIYSPPLSRFRTFHACPLISYPIFAAKSPLDSPFSLRSFSRHSRKNATPSYLSSPSTSFTVHTFHSFTLILRVSPTRISSIIKLHTQPLFHQFVTIPLSLSPLLQDKFVLW